MKKTAIVIGATGLVGSHLLRLLEEAGHVSRILMLTRRAVQFESKKIENHVIDFEDLDKHRDLFVGDMLFSCLGTTVKQAGSIAAQRRVDLEYQHTAARLARENDVNHYLLVSSSGANDQSLSPYLRMKGELETKICALAFMHTSIVQPSLLIGDRDHYRFAEALGSKVMPVLCRAPGLKRFRPIHGSQVAQKMVTLSEKPQKKYECISLDAVFPS